VPSEALTKLYPEKFPAHVVITMQDGQVHEATFYYPKGDPNNPLSDEELRIKFRANAAGCFDTIRTEALMQAIDHLEQGSLEALTDVLGQA
jgi:2-methylcitrate dehydratase PrpD